MTVFEAGKTYRTRSGCTARVYATDAGDPWSIHGAYEERKGHWRQKSWDANGRLCSTFDALDLIPPEPPIPPVFVTDAMWRAYTDAGYGFASLGAAVNEWLTKHPHALAGYRRDCGEREGGE